MIARLSLFFSYDKAKQIFYYSLLCIYTVSSESVPSSQQIQLKPETSLRPFVNTAPEVTTSTATLHNLAAGIS